MSTGAGQIQGRLEGWAARLADVRGAAPLFASATAAHYQRQPIRERTGRMARAFRDTGSRDFQFAPRPDGFGYRNAVPYVGAYVREVAAPPVGVYNEALRRWVWEDA